ncbi:hypothetical protein QN277_010317 [Acacia crassicarpa]|uniref:Uncharacterized protein n=1 Tax=Acacia crassicarpa TaxID=499986 RepID=A0AAE1M567_9FABA|nr:hypothetical protein QN277_010317 [Acacia crassicarpa]
MVGLFGQREENEEKLGWTTLSHQRHNRYNLQLRGRFPYRQLHKYDTIASASNKQTNKFSHLPPPPLCSCLLFEVRSRLKSFKYHHFGLISALNSEFKQVPILRH